MGINTTAQLSQIHQNVLPLRQKSKIRYIKNRISLIDTNGMLAPEERTANLFSDHFSSVYNEPVERGVYRAPCIEVTKCLSEVAISEEMV